MIPLALASFHQTKDAKSQGKDLAMRNLSQFIPASSCVGVTAPRISLLCPSGTIYAIFFCYSELYTHKQMYLNKYGCITYKMYKEAENDLAVKFYHMSSQCKTRLVFFFFGWFVGCVCLFVCFSESPEHHSSHSKARPRANAGAALSSTAGILNTHGKQVKNCRKSQKKRIMLTARSTPGQLGTQLVRGWGCIRSENKVRRVCQLEMGKFCNYLNMSMPACSERRLGA